jgi:tripartite-type tricarboxylate transporter receptor subunit TctC
MKLPRRTFLHLAAGAAALPTVRIAKAQIYPSRTVRLIVGFGAGSASDILARPARIPASRVEQVVVSVGPEQRSEPAKDETATPPRPG